MSEGGRQERSRGSRKDRSRSRSRSPGLTKAQLRAMHHGECLERQRLETELKRLQGWVDAAAYRTREMLLEIRELRNAVDGVSHTLAGYPRHLPLQGAHAWGTARWSDHSNACQRHRSEGGRCICGAWS